MERVNRGPIGGAALALAIALVAGVQPAAGQEGGGWFPYLGCWEPEAEGTPADGAATVCFAPGASAAAVEMITLADGAISGRRTAAVRARAVGSRSGLLGFARPGRGACCCRRSRGLGVSRASPSRRRRTGGREGNLTVSSSSPPMAST